MCQTTPGAMGAGGGAAGEVGGAGWLVQIASARLSASAAEFPMAMATCAVAAAAPVPLAQNLTTCAHAGPHAVSYSIGWPRRLAGAV